MGKQLKVTYTVTDVVYIDADDFQYSQTALENIVDKRLKEVLRDDVRNVKTDLETAILSKEQSLHPPKAFIFEFLGRKCASNGPVLIFKECPVRKVYKKAWQVVDDTSGIEKHFNKEYLTLHKHPGWFNRELIQEFLDAGLTFLGESPDTVAYVLDKDLLVALIMPMLFLNSAIDCKKYCRIP